MFTMVKDFGVVSDVFAVQVYGKKNGALTIIHILHNRNQLSPLITQYVLFFPY